MKTIVRFSAVLLTLIMIVCAMTLVSAATYSDVDSKTAHVDAIDTLSALGIIGGYEDGSFKPLDPVQRDEMAKMIYIMATTFADAGEGVATFPDVPAKQWANGFISWCHGKSIVGGYEDGTFRPDDNITFNEALKMACAMLGYNDFNPDMWPTDMVAVAVGQLGLDDGIEIDPFLAGDTVITRAEAAQILYNAFTKSMKTTKTVTRYQTGYFEQDGVTAATREVKVQVPMTLAEDVWNCEVKSYQVVATENYGIKFLDVTGNTVTAGVRDLATTRITYQAAKTDSDTLIRVCDNNNVVTNLDVVEDLGLDEYRKNTDALMFLTYSLVFKDGEQIGTPSLRGSKTEKLPVAIVKSTTEGANTVKHDASNIYFTDRITLDGILHDGENHENLRVALLNKEDGVYTIYNVKPDNASSSDPAKSGIYLTPDLRISLYEYQPYVGYLATHTGWDTNGDGFYDIVSKEFPQALHVTAVSIENGVKMLHYDLLHSVGKMYDGDSVDEGPYKIAMADVISPRELATGDVFVGYNLSNVKLQVMNIVEPVTAKATAADATYITLENIGRVSQVQYYFVGSIPGANTILDLRNAAEDFLTADPATRSVPEYDYWIYNSKVIKCSATVDEQPTEHNKAILLYVDEKPEKQIDKNNNKYVQFYPAYILVNGKEEAINLNPNKAINDASGDYVSAEESIYRATVNTDQTLNFVYIPVTYTVDLDGYYSLYTTASDIIDDNDTPNDDTDDVVLEKVIPESENPELSFNTNTELYTLTTDSETYNRVKVDESTFLYYIYTKPSTGAYEYISFYTSDNVPTTEFTSIDFVSNVYLSYDEETNFYTLKFGVLDGKFDFDDGVTVTDYNEDGRVIYMALTDSAKVNFEEQAHYEHTFYNVLTGETFTAINKDLSVLGGANNTVAGTFYAWSEAEQDWVEVTAKGALNSALTLNGYSITSYNENLGIIYTDTGDYTDGLKIADDFKLFAFDDELNVYDELTFADIVNLWDIYDAEGDTLRMVFVTYEDENGDMVTAYAMVEWAEVIENGDGTVENVIHDNVISFIWE